MASQQEDIRDRILRLLLETEDPMTDIEIAHKLNVRVGPIRTIGREFIRFHMIQQFTPHGDAHYLISIKEGLEESVQLFLQEGGFTRLQAEKEEEARKKKEKEEYDLEISRNLVKEFPFTKRAARWALGLGIFSALLSLLAVIISIYKK